jgi:hypothetical protein
LLGKPVPGDSTRFPGGWLGNPYLTLWGLDRDNLTTLALASFHRLVLRDAATATKLGVSSDRERLRLQLRTALAMGKTLVSAGGSNHAFLEVPGYPYQPNRVSFDTLWYTLPLRPGSSWFWNTYQVEAIATLLLYAEIAADLEREGIPSPSPGIGWNSAQVRAVATRGLDGLLGVNPWDLSLVHGIGAKNPNHPHHRTSNPEGRTLPFPYTYQPPLGAVHQGVDPSTYVLTDAFAKYSESEPCLEGSTSLLIPAVLLSKAQPSTSSIQQPVAATGTVPSFAANSTRRGVRLRWSNTTGVVDVTVIDVAGRQTATLSSKEGQGELEIPLTRRPGQRFLRIRNGNHQKTFVFPEL